MIDSATPAGSVTSQAANLQMVQIHLDLPSFHRWVGIRNLTRMGTFDEGYALHCLLTESFGEWAPRPFRLIAPRNKGLPRGILYGYSRSGKEVLTEAARTYSDPDQFALLNVDGLRCKPMPVKWDTGRKLGFEVLVRPTIRTARGSEIPGAERDAYLQEIEKSESNNIAMSRSEVYANWIRAQFDRLGGATIEKIELSLFQRVRVIRSLKSRPIEGPNAVMKGILTITNESAFNHLLARGIGRHRAYGYGMLLLHPADARLSY